MLAYIHSLTTKNKKRKNETKASCCGASIWKADTGGLWLQQPYFLLKEESCQIKSLYTSQFQEVLMLTPLISSGSRPHKCPVLFTYHYCSCHLMQTDTQPHQGDASSSSIRKSGLQQFSIQQCHHFRYPQTWTFFVNDFIQFSSSTTMTHLQQKLSL